MFFQFAMVVVKMGNEFFDIDKNVFKNILEMYEIILPFEWHSFCMTIDLTENTMKMYHNDHLQVVQNFTVVHQDQEGLSKLMTRGHLGGQKFVGYIADFQVFGSALPENEILSWTSCQTQVIEECLKHQRIFLKTNSILRTNIQSFTYIFTCNNKEV